MKPMDTIADMLIRIKNAGNAKKEAVSFEYSKLKFAIAQVLERNGYIADVQKRGRKNYKGIDVKILYGADGSPKVSGVKRVSKLSRRAYRGYREIYPVRNGLGIAVYSTPKGILTNKETRKEKTGGEILFEIW